MFLRPTASPLPNRAQPSCIYCRAQNIFDTFSYDTTNKPKDTTHFRHIDKKWVRLMEAESSGTEDTSPPSCCPLPSGVPQHYQADCLPPRWAASNSLNFSLASLFRFCGTCICTHTYWSPCTSGFFMDTTPFPRSRIFVPDCVPSLILQSTFP